MRISVKAKPGAKEEKIEQVGENEFKISVKEPPQKGRANFAIERALAGYFKVSVYNVKLISGFSSKNKIFEIEM